MSLQSEYDRWHQRIHEADPDHDDALSPWYRLVREQMGAIAGLRILEVACGRGGFVSELLRAGGRVTGCDFSSAALKAAAGKVPRTSEGLSAALVRGDAQSLPFADSSFDMVVSCETIEHLPQAGAAVREMHRVTRFGGQLFLTTPNYANFMGVYEVYAKFRHPGRKDDQPFDRRQWFPEIRRCIREAGWTIIRTDGTVHQFPFVPGRNPVRWEGLEANRTVRKLLSPFAYTYFVAAEKAGRG
jgi:ubiquinone/menaquinone biosynthesis C-methylase UbiE